MEFNTSKCQVLYIARSRNPVRYNYTTYEQALESVENAWYLGVDISSKLGSPAISTESPQMHKNLVFLKRKRKTINSDIREAVYKTIAQPQLEYASTTWSLYTK